MKKVGLFLFLFSLTFYAQQLRFVNYAIDAPKNEGDDNYLQVINFEIPKSYEGNIYIKIFDMNCGGDFDLPIGVFNSKFRFSFYLGELKEESFLAQKNFRDEISNFLIRTKEVGNDLPLENNWTLFDVAKCSGSEAKYYSLVVEGLEGNDANIFEVALYSDVYNKPIDSLKTYSYEPTVILNQTKDRGSYKIFVPSGTEEVELKTFDSDNTRSYFSTILRNDIPNVENNSAGWNSTKFRMNEFEQGNYSSIDYGHESKPYNVFTFKVQDQFENKLPIELPDIKKAKAVIPSIVHKLIYLDCNTFVLDLTQSHEKNNGALRYKINFADGFSSEESKVKHSFSNPGKYFADIYAEEISSAITKAKLERIEININKHPIAKAVVPQIGAPGEQLSFDANASVDSDGKITKYYWDFGDGSTSILANPKHNYAKPGTYKIILKVEDDFSSVCNFSIDTAEVKINSQPVIKTKEEIFGSPNEILTFDASNTEDNDGQIIKYHWDFGALGSKEGSVVEMSFPNPGLYFVKLTVNDNSAVKNSSAVSIIKVKINFPPKAVAGNSIIVGENESFTLDAAKSNDKDGRLINYDWDLGDGVFASGIRTLHNFKKAGKYYVKLIVKDDSRTSSDTAVDSVLVIVNKRPKAVIQNGRFSKTMDVEFDASNSADDDGHITKYLWDFGDGSKSEAKKIVHKYKLPGTYKIILKVLDNTLTSNNFAFDTSFVTINKLPIADAGPDYVIAPNQKIVFNGKNSVDQDGRIAQTKWFINKESVSDSVVYEHTFSEPGTYYVDLEVTDDFVHPLKDSDQAVVKVNNAPVVKILAPKLAVPNQKIKFDGSSSYDKDGTIIKYEWKFSDGETASKNSVEKAFSKPGIYSAELTVYDDSKVSNSISKEIVTVKVNTQPEIKIIELIETCENIISFDASASIDADGDNLKFYWDFPDEKNVEGSSKIVRAFSERGIFPVFVTADDGNGLSNSVTKKTIVVKLHQPPIADAGNDTTVCVGEFVILNGQKSKSAANELLEYEWLFDDSTKQIGNNVVKVFNKGGIYKVTLVVKDNSGLSCNYDIDTKVIRVMEAPVASAGDDIFACANTPVRFDGSKSTDVDGLVNSFDWDFGDGETGGGVNPYHIYKKAGVYKATLTISGDVKGDCNNTSKDEVTVTVSEAPLAIFSCRDSIPENYEAAFDASACQTSVGVIKSYDWDFGDGQKAQGQIVKQVFRKSGNYNVNLRIITDAGTQCNKSEFSKSIYVNAQPVAVAKTVSKGAIGELIYFDGSKSYDLDGEISSYNWDFGDGSLAEGVNVAHSFLRSGSYNISLTVKDETGIENNSHKKTFTILINEPPRANFYIGESTNLNSEVILDASNSVDVDGQIISYMWYVNDEVLSKEKITKYKIDKEGIYIIRLVVEDDSKQKNNLGEFTRVITVNNKSALE